MCVSQRRAGRHAWFHFTKVTRERNNAGQSALSDRRAWPFAASRLRCPARLSSLVSSAGDGGLARCRRWATHWRRWSARPPAVVSFAGDAGQLLWRRWAGGWRFASSKPTRVQSFGRVRPIDSLGPRANRASPGPLVVMVNPDAGNRQRAGDDRQRCRRPWSVSLAALCRTWESVGPLVGRSANPPVWSTIRRFAGP